MFDFKAQKARSELFMNIRSYFLGKDYLEVFTPTLSPSLIPEPTIKAFGTKFTNEFVGDLDLFMIPSPEIFMKEMLSSGSGSIFQISQCFRNAEQLGDVHNPEFTMLEYYTVGYDDNDSIGLTIDMIGRTAISHRPWMDEKPLVITMEEAFWKYAGVNLEKCQDLSHLRAEAERLGSHFIPEDESWEDTFNRIFLTHVETQLPKDREVYLRDYPVQIECLAKEYSDRPYRKRWEMYIEGIEVANCYDEETDKGKIAAYYRKEQEKLVAERTRSGEVISQADMAFTELQMPSSSGVAIGLDRLLLAEYGGTEIAPLLAFPMCSMLKA